VPLDNLPDGLKVYVRQGFDKLFLGACNNHDRCYAQCNTENPPYLDLSQKSSCDLTFLIEMEDACILWASLISFPVDDQMQTADDFIAFCNGGLAPIFYGAVAFSPQGTEAFWSDQCSRGCNPNACSILGRTLPSGCGALQGQTAVPPGPNTWTYQTNEFCQCYVRQELQPPPDPIPPIFPLPLACLGVSCCSYSCSPLQEYCCGGCNYGFWDPFYGPGRCGSPWDPWNPWDPWDPWDPWGPWGPWGPWWDQLPY
jgi:hypothetical protein